MKKRIVIGAILLVVLYVGYVHLFSNRHDYILVENDNYKSVINDSATYVIKGDITFRGVYPIYYDGIYIGEYAVYIFKGKNYIKVRELKFNVKTDRKIKLKGAEINGTFFYYIFKKNVV